MELVSNLVFLVVIQFWETAIATIVCPDSTVLILPWHFKYLVTLEATVPLVRASAQLVHLAITVRLWLALKNPVAPFLATTVVTVLEGRLVVLFAQPDMPVNRQLRPL